MTDTHIPGELDLRFEARPDWTRVVLAHADRALSSLAIIPFTLRVGRALVRMDGIGGVGTDAEYRHRGFARRVLEAAVDRMRAGDAALSMLYGIPDIYPKFGYATAGPDPLLFLAVRPPAPPLPEGWNSRPFHREDLPAIRDLYGRNTREAVGAAVR
ncbi:MAG TPA: GNAT family N-acetyltransferase, partial [Longimicrobium sp.]|nr:GNAT family N-acetyltransferase [Longimicrobium sp.]